MRVNFQFWEQIGAPEDIIQVIKHGYKIPFVNSPPSARFNNNKSAINNSDFVIEAVNDLLSKGLIVECATVPDIVNPLTVSIQSSGKNTLILDLHYVNHFMWKQKIHFDDWNVAKEYFTLGHYMFAFDLKSGYH